MKKNLLLVALLIVLAAVAYYLVQSQNGSKVVYEDRNFAIENIESIGKIILADHKANKTTLEKKGVNWIVNDRFGVNERRFETFMNTLKDVEIKYIPSRAESETAIRQFTSYPNQIKIYDTSGELLRSYFIGGTNANGNGTYMMMDGADKVFVMHLAYMEGAVDLRYHADTEYWIAKEVFPLLDENKIKEVTVDFTDRKTESMVINLPDYTMEKLYPDNDKKVVAQEKLKAFVARLMDLRAGRIFADLEGHAKEDVQSRAPKLEFKFVLANGETESYPVFLRYRRNQLGELIEGKKELYAPRQKEATYLIESPVGYYYAVNDSKLAHIFQSIQ